jgi:hypothetical protein
MKKLETPPIEDDSEQTVLDPIEGNSEQVVLLTID